MRSFALFLALLLIAPSAARADLVITEVAANPAVAEPNGEFVVVLNDGPATVLLDGTRLTDSGRAVRGVVPPDTSLDPGQRIALQPSSGAAAYACSPLPHRALLTAWAPLNNTGDSVLLEAADGRVLDRVDYPADWFVVDGPSRVLDTATGRWNPSAGAATPCSLPPPRTGRVRFAESEAVVAESTPAATLEVLRSGGTNARIDVPWRSLDASATRGTDYSAEAGTVTFRAGQIRATFAVPLIADDRDEADETFTVVLGGEATKEPTRAVVRVRDDDAPALPVLAPTVPGTPLPVLTPGPEPVRPPAAAPAPGGPPAAPPAPAAPPPRTSLAVAAWQRVLRHRALTAVVACDRPCEARVGGTIALGGGRFARLKPITRHLAANAPTLLSLRLPARYVKPLQRALRQRGSLTASITAAAAGGDTTARRVRIR
jgi:Calx-beta domain/Lamin Tail Domain